MKKYFRCYALLKYEGHCLLPVSFVLWFWGGSCCVVGFKVIKVVIDLNDLKAPEYPAQKKCHRNKKRLKPKITLALQLIR